VAERVTAIRWRSAMLVGNSDASWGEWLARPTSAEVWDRLPLASASARIVEKMPCVSHDLNTVDRMPKYRCTVTVDAESVADAEAQAVNIMFERARGQHPADPPVCELEALVAIREAPESELRDADRRIRLELAAAQDGASLEEVAAAKRANGHWPGSMSHGAV
jgi:hypothetical protein